VDDKTHDLAPAAREALEPLLHRFEQAWRQGQRPALEQYLPAAGPQRRAALVELVRTDLEYRLEAGEPARAEDYLQRYPELAADRPAALDLIAREYELRRPHEPRLTPDDYLGRFPQYRAELSARLRPAAGPAAPSPDSVAALGAVLRDSQMLERAQLEELTVLQGRFAEPRGLARELLQRDWLTAYQVNQILQGKGDQLVLGPYLLLERLGAGGMGQVFKARHRLMKRLVALKVIRKDRLADPEAVARFQREIRAAAQLSHPNIVIAHDAAQVGDTHFLVMEYVEGTDLARLVKQQGPLPVAQACDYVRQAALGLQHAHERGLVHRDVKPANLLLTRSGVVKVLDVGLARLHPAGGETVAEVTHEGAVMGTPDYIAPEQACESHTVDIRADIYSLGCTLYHLLTGRCRFPAARWCRS
jgi:tRNA A-37 threonylcarbamoyl transferase component Bud32